MPTRRNQPSDLPADSDGSETRAQKLAEITWRLGSSSPRVAHIHDVRNDAARVRDLHLSAREERRIVEMAERMLTAAGMSPDPAARERASRLVDTICQLAALLHRLSAPV